MRWLATQLRRRRWLLAIGAVLVLAAAAAGAAVILGGGHRAHGSVAANSAPPSSQDLAAVTAVLQRHAQALQGRDRAGWVGDLDTSAPAAGYRQTQTALFDNIVDVPLEQWRYEVTSPVLTPDVLQHAAERLGTRVVVVRVAVRYQLRDVDPQPTSRDAWITASLRGGHWRLSGDSDVADQAGQSWQGPWDFGPVSVRRTAHVLVLAHPQTISNADAFAALVEQSLPQVDSVWGGAWNHSIAVLIPNDASEFAAVSGEAGETATLAAVTVADDVTTDGVVLGARMVINPQNLAALSPDGRRLVVQHELAHLATKAVTNDAMPTWLVEGFADYIGNLAVPEPVPAAAAELAIEVKARHVPTELPTADDFAPSSTRLAAVYEEAWLACRLVANDQGQATLVRFYRTVAERTELDPVNGVAQAFTSVLHTDEKQFTRHWRQSLTTELGR